MREHMGFANLAGPMKDENAGGTIAKDGRLVRAKGHRVVILGRSFGWRKNGAACCLRDRLDVGVH
jgi:hypothetical protein